MEKSKLISMTAFVLQIEAEVNAEDYQVVAWQTKIHGYDRINKYANFIKQPLTLGMFVPCDDDGNVLDQFIHIIDGKISSDFKKAKSKVIFEGFEINDLSKEINPRLKHDDFYLHFNRKEGIRTGGGYTMNTIEDLIRFNVYLSIFF